MGFRDTPDRSADVSMVTSPEVVEEGVGKENTGSGNKGMGTTVGARQPQGGKWPHKPVMSVYLPPRSLLVMSGDAYDKYLHGIDEVGTAGLLLLRFDLLAWLRD